MLSPQELELLTAHVDGELSAPQRRQAVALLERSGEARDMLRWLEEDARRLRQAPRRAVPTDLTAGVLEEIGKLARKPRPKPAPRVLKFPVWRGLAAAAGVLALVGVGSFLANRQGNVPDGKGGVATKTGKDDGKGRPDPDNGGIAKVGPEEDDGKGKTVVKGGNPVEKGKGTLSANDKAKTKDQGTATPGVMAANDETPPRLEKVEVDLATVARLHDLHKDENHKALTERLGKLKAARVELTAKDGPRAFEKLRAAMQARKINLHVDPNTQTRLKKSLPKTDVLVFLEHVKAEDVAGLLREAGVADREGPTRFDGAVVVKDLSRWDRDELKGVLGFDPIVKKVMPRQKTNVDIRSDFPELTGREVVAALDGVGVPRPGNDPVHHAYVSHLPATKGWSPPELKRFLDLRQPPRAGTLQVLMLVLRHVGS